jgi:cell division protein FtsQ
MARDISRAQKALAASRWQRFVRGLKRVVTAVSLITMAGLLGFATKLATDMPVEAIAITGEMRHVDRRDLENVIAPQVENGFLLTDLTSIREDIEALAWVYDTNVRREWPGTIKVHVTEQQPIARWGKAAYINQHGFVFDGEFMSRYSELPMLWSEQNKPPALIEHFKLFQMLLLPHGLAVAALNEDRLGQVSAELTDGTDVQFGDKDFAQRVRRFVALLESEDSANSIARIDFRYERGAAVLRREQSFAVTTVAREQGGR